MSAVYTYPSPAPGSRKIEITLKAVSPEPEFTLGDASFGRKTLDTVLSMRPLERAQVKAVFDREGESTARDINEHVDRLGESGEYFFHTPYTAFRTLIKYSRPELGLCERTAATETQRGIRGAAVPDIFKSGDCWVGIFMAEKGFFDQGRKDIQVRIGSNRTVPLHTILNLPKLAPRELTVLGHLATVGEKGITSWALRRLLFTAGQNDHNVGDVVERLSRHGYAVESDSIYTISEPGREYLEIKQFADRQQR